MKTDANSMKETVYCQNVPLTKTYPYGKSKRTPVEKYNNITRTHTNEMIFVLYITRNTTQVSLSFSKA